MGIKNSFLYVAYVEGDNQGTVVGHGRELDWKAAYWTLEDRGYITEPISECEIDVDYEELITNEGFTILDVQLQ